jgi:hypothetical protein
MGGCAPSRYQLHLSAGEVDSDVGVGVGDGDGDENAVFRRSGRAIMGFWGKSNIKGSECDAPALLNSFSALPKRRRSDNFHAQRRLGTGSFSHNVGEEATGVEISVSSLISSAVKSRNLDLFIRAKQFETEAFYS